MGYESIDGELNAWAAKRALVWQTQSRDWEVRSILFDDQFQLWVDIPNDGQVVVHAAKNSSDQNALKKEGYRCNLVELPATLDKALSQLTLWMKSDRAV